MQPRRDLRPLRGEMVFQVMKRGWPSSLGVGGGNGGGVAAVVAGEGCLERPKEKKEDADDDFELPPPKAA